MNKETFIHNLLLRCPVTLDHAAAKLGYKNAVTAIDGTKLEDELYKTHAYMCLSWATFYADALQTVYHDELFDGSFEVLDNQPAAEEPADPAPETVSVKPQPATSAATTTPRASGAVNAGSGSHVVQVGAFRSNDEAMAQWGRMQTKMGDFLLGKGPDVETADLGDRGVYYRLRVGPFSSSDDAKTYCAGLKERGQDCLVKAL